MPLVWAVANVSPCAQKPLCGGLSMTRPPLLQVKADKHSPHLSRLQECSRAVNEMAANVVASSKSGQEQIEERGACGPW